MTVSVQGARACFHGNKNGTNQTGLASNTPTLITFGELYDIGGFFDTVNSKWTPPAGKIVIGGRVYMTGTLSVGNNSWAILYKDGVAVMNGAMGCVSGLGYPQVTFEDTCTGSNYYQLYGQIQLTSGTATVSGDITLTQFYGHWISP